MKSIIEPKSLLGKVILRRTFSSENLEKFKADKQQDLIDYVKDHVKVFPKYLLTTESNDWYKWHLISDRCIIYKNLMEKEIMKNEIQKKKRKIQLFKNDEVKNYITIPDYRRGLKNYDKFDKKEKKK